MKTAASLIPVVTVPVPVPAASDPGLPVLLAGRGFPGRATALKLEVQAEPERP